MKSQESTLQDLSHEREVLEGKRFAFGKNWLQFLQVSCQHAVDGEFVSV